MTKVLASILLFFFINGSFVAAFNSASASGLVANSWNTKTPMNYPRYDLGVVAVNDRIYAIGGHGFDGLTGVNECYDTVTDTWTIFASMPTPRGDFAAAACDEKIYCIGGYSKGASNGEGWVSYDNCRVVEVYDAVTDSWSTKASMPFSRILQAHVVDGQIFAITATIPYTYTYDLYLYDFGTDAWINKTSVPVVSESLSASFVSAVVNDKIIITVACFNYDIQNYEQKILIYNAETDVWSEGHSGSERVDYGVAGVTSGLYAPKKMYILRANYAIAFASLVPLVYDPIGDSWSTTQPMLTPRTRFGAAVVNDVLYVIGGYTSTENSWPTTIELCSLNEQYVPIGYGTNSVPTNSVVFVATIILTISLIVITLFFYTKRSKNKKKLDALFL